MVGGFGCGGIFCSEFHLKRRYEWLILAVCVRL
jgi:hypothetical protein